MQGKYKVITLCGSTKFKNEFLETQKNNTKPMLDDMHKAKIDMADEIFVINVNGYIGDSTKSEIEYAKEKGKTIRYLEDEKFVCDHHWGLTRISTDEFSVVHHYWCIKCGETKSMSMGIWYFKQQNI